MNRKQFFGLITALIFILASGTFSSAVADRDLETIKAANNRIDALLRELQHVVQQGQSDLAFVMRTAVGGAKSETIGSSKTETTDGEGLTSSRLRPGAEMSKGKSTGKGGKPKKRMAVVIITAANISALADQIINETGKLQRIYRQRNLKDGSRYARSIGDEARQIKRLSTSLGQVPTARQAGQYYSRVSERLRHKQRSQDEHDKWIDVLSIDWGSSQGKAGEEIIPDEYGRVKSKLPNQPAAGNPDRPLVTGRVYNTEKPSGKSGSAGNTGTVQTEMVSLNLNRSPSSPVNVAGIYSYRNRMVLHDGRGGLYALPDGVYRNEAGDKLLVRGKSVTVKGGKSMVLKGKKILENYKVPPGGLSAKVVGFLPARRTPVPTINGQYKGPGGAWLEISGNRIVRVGGSLDKHQPPPFVDVNGDSAARVSPQDALIIINR